MCIEELVERNTIADQLIEKYYCGLLLFHHAASEWFLFAEIDYLNYMIG